MKYILVCKTTKSGSKLNILEAYIIKKWMGHAIVLFCDGRELLLPIWLQNVGLVT